MNFMLLCKVVICKVFKCCFKCGRHIARCSRYTRLFLFMHRHDRKQPGNGNTRKGVLCIILCATQTVLALSKGPEHPKKLSLFF